jgi:hypothetical protein
LAQRCSESVDRLIAFEQLVLELDDPALQFGDPPAVGL